MHIKSFLISDVHRPGTLMAVNLLEPIPRPLSTAIGCKDRGSALSAKKVLNVPQHASEPFWPPALTTAFSLGLVTKQVLGWVLVFALIGTSACAQLVAVNANSLSHRVPLPGDFNRDCEVNLQDINFPG